MKRKNAIVIALCLVILTTFFSGCGEEKDSGVGAEADVVDFVCVTSEKENARDIYVITKVHTSQYWQELCQGAKQAGLDLGCNIYIGGTLSETDTQGQLELLELARVSDADAILLAPIDSNAVYAPIQEIRADGVPVILVDTIMNSNNFDVCLMTDNMQAGRMVAQDMLKQLTEAGHTGEEELQVGIQIGSRTSQTIVERVAGFYEYWSEYAPKRWTILDEIYCNESNIDRAETMAAEMLEKYPDVKGIVGCNNGSTVGLARHIKKAGRKDIVLVGFDFSDEVAELIRDEEYNVSSVIQQQYEMGYQGVIAAVKLIKGEHLNYKFVDTQVELIDSDNVERYTASLQ